MPQQLKSYSDLAVLGGWLGGSQVENNANFWSNFQDYKISSQVEIPKLDPSVAKNTGSCKTPSRGPGFPPKIIFCPTDPPKGPKVSRRSGGQLAMTLVTTINDIISPPFFFSVFYFSHRRRARIKKHILRKLTGASKNMGRHLSRPCRPFWGPLAAILDFAGSGVLRAVSKCPRNR